MTLGKTTCTPTHPYTPTSTPPYCQINRLHRPTATVQGPFGIPIPPGFNPTRFAAKALAIGTVLCLSATGAVAFVVGRAMGVRDVYEFADAVRAWAPRKRRELEGWLGVKVSVGAWRRKGKKREFGLGRFAFRALNPCARSHIDITCHE